MMQISNCEHCGKTDIGFDCVSVSVELSKSNHCDKCYQLHTDKQYHFFCSLNCFREYMKDQLARNTFFEWKQ